MSRMVNVDVKIRYNENILIRLNLPYYLFINNKKIANLILVSILVNDDIKIRYK